MQLVKEVRRAALFLVAAWLLGINLAQAAPEAHLLRVDPRASVEEGKPTLTTVIDVSEPKRLGQATARCASLRGKDELECLSAALESSQTLAVPFAFPEKRVKLRVRVGNRDVTAPLLSHARFADSEADARIGTAWLLVLDADERMGSSLERAKEMARAFLSAMGPHDLANLMVVTDRNIAADSGWVSRNQAATAKLLAETERPVRATGRTRPLLDLLKKAAETAFRHLSQAEGESSLPLHQAMVVLSTGYGGGDPATTGPGATELSKYLTRGRLDEANTAQLRAPLPVISIYFAPKTQTEQQQIARTFMENLANQSIGGFFTVASSERKDQPRAIVDAVRGRFANMIVARFSLPCVAPTATQSFSLLFDDEGPLIVGDSSFKDVPVGIDPRKWPLEIDRELTRSVAVNSGGIAPGSTFKVFGSFCWGTDVQRPEVYFLPPGETLPKDMSNNPDAARGVQKRLASLDMRAAAVAANQTFAEFRAPPTDQILHGAQERRVVRLLVVDTQMQRTSGVSETSILTLKARARPMVFWPWLLAGALLLLLVLVLSLVLRKGTSRARETSDRGHIPDQDSPYATPAPVTRRPPQAKTASKFVLDGAAGRFTILPAVDLRFGRDAGRCAAVLSHPQVSGLHATFRIEHGSLLVRDESSSAGTCVDGRKLESGKWENLRPGSEVSLGPEVLTVLSGDD